MSAPKADALPLGESPVSVRLKNLIISPYLVNKICKKIVYNNGCACYNPTMIKSENKQKKGFTIIELIVVIAVIGILAGISIVGFKRYQADTRDARRSSSITSISEALEKYYDINGEYPSCSALSATGTSVSQTTLKGIDQSTLVAPQASSSDTNSIKCTSSGNVLNSGGVDFFEYQGDNSTNCNGSVSCPQFVLKYKDESSGTVKTISSRRSTVVAVTTLAGTTATGSTDGVGSTAQFYNPFGIAIDSSGTIYVADGNNNRIRKITPAGVVSTLAGSTSGYADGTGSAAKFSQPVNVAVDSSGTVYVADTSNLRIRKITSGGVVTTLAGSIPIGSADGTGSAAKFNNPKGVAVDSSGTVYVADTGNNLIRKITPAGVVTTLAGSVTAGYVDGSGSAARFNYPYQLAVDSSGMIYVADYYNNSIRKITPAGVVTTLAGSVTAGSADGTGSAAQFYSPSGVAVDSSGTVYVADNNNNRIRKITPAGVVTTLAGSTAGYADGTGSAIQFYNPAGVTVGSSGTVYVADTYNNRIRKIQ